MGNRHPFYIDFIQSFPCFLALGKFTHVKPSKTLFAFFFMI